MSPHYQWNGPSMGSYLLLLFFQFFFFWRTEKEFIKLCIPSTKLCDW
jgi:hypothetical protein